MVRCVLGSLVMFVMVDDPGTGVFIQLSSREAVCVGEKAGDRREEILRSADWSSTEKNR